MRDHWSGVWAPRLARVSSRKGENVDLVAVEKVICGFHRTTLACNFEVTGRFASGVEVKRRMFSVFDRDREGKLVDAYAAHRAGAPAQ